MADDSENPEIEEGATGGGQISLVQLIIALVALTVIGAAAGGLLGIKLVGLAEHAIEARPELKADMPEPAYSDGATLVALPPIVTNLGAPKDVWIRLEAAVVFRTVAEMNTDVVVAMIGEDILAYLRTVSLYQIEGASGFLHLREDLLDRAMIRTKGKVSDLVITSLVLE